METEQIAIVIPDGNTLTMDWEGELPEHGTSIHDCGKNLLRFAEAAGLSGPGLGVKADYVLFSQHSYTQVGKQTLRVFYAHRTVGRLPIPVRKEDAMAFINGWLTGKNDRYGTLGQALNVIVDTFEWECDIPDVARFYAHYGDEKPKGYFLWKNIGEITCPAFQSP